jgi:SsrA-binding protein
MKVVATNRKAKRDYQILEIYEAGMELKGMEVKSLRTRGCSIEDSFARIEGAQAYLYNMHIPEFSKSSYFKLDPKRIRKLLLHRREIKRLLGLVTQRRLTLIPLKVYFNDRGLAKVEIALVRGRRYYEKRRKIKEAIAKQEAERELKRFYRKSG